MVKTMKRVDNSNILTSLESEDTALRLRALKTVKNQIIGNKSKKTCFIQLGAVQKVVAGLSPDSPDVNVIQSVQTLGSFAKHPDGVQVVLECGGIAELVKTLSSCNEKVVEAGMRSLNMALTVRSFAGGRIPLLLPFASKMRTEVHVF
jgi:hypothetical protein